jgi:hypothetical protein
MRELERYWVWNDKLHEGSGKEVISSLKADTTDVFLASEAKAALKAKDKALIDATEDAILQQTLRIEAEQRLKAKDEEIARLREERKHLIIWYDNSTWQGSITNGVKLRGVIESLRFALRTDEVKHDPT